MKKQIIILLFILGAMTNVSSQRFFNRLSLQTQSGMMFPTIDYKNVLFKPSIDIEVYGIYSLTSKTFLSIGYKRMTCNFSVKELKSVLHCSPGGVYTDNCYYSRFWDYNTQPGNLHLVPILFHYTYFENEQLSLQAIAGSGFVFGDYEKGLHQKAPFLIKVLFNKKLNSLFTGYIGMEYTSVINVFDITDYHIGIGPVIGIKFTNENKE